LGGLPNSTSQSGDEGGIKVGKRKKKLIEVGNCFKVYF